MNFLKSLFGNYSKREVKRIQPIADKVLALESKYAAMSESELKNQTTLLKERLANGETTDDILPDAFAACREASWRVLGMKHFPVQVLGGIVLHQGRIAEMKTGEGKTLVATLPAYLNALTGNGVHIVTVNDYLARRDSEWMGKLYKYMGLKVGLIVHDLENDLRKEAYAADITYGTNNELGFDYLRDNMVVYKENKVQRGHAFAIVDEVDSILIDEARTPLIISGKGDKSTDLYEKADAFAKTLKLQRFTELDSKEDMEAYYEENGIDYVVDEKQKTATLTQLGVKKAEEHFGLENLTDPENLTISHHINQAIKANGVMKLDVDYVVKDGEVIIVDEFTGRLMYGRRFNEGLPELLPSVRQAVGHDRYRSDRERGVPGDLQARRCRGSDQQARYPSGSSRLRIQDRARQVQRGNRPDRRGEQEGSAGACRYYFDRKIRAALEDAQAPRCCAQRSQREAARQGSRDRRSGR